MATHAGHSEEAVRIYAIAVAHLLNEPIHNTGLTNAPHVKEIAPHHFHIWRQQPQVQDQPIVPVAICTYTKQAGTWKVEISGGETLTLLDKGNIWVIVDEETSPKGKAQKRVGRPRKHKSKGRRR